MIDYADLTSPVNVAVKNQRSFFNKRTILTEPGYIVVYMPFVLGMCGDE